MGYFLLYLGLEGGHLFMFTTSIDWKWICSFFFFFGKSRSVTHVLGNQILPSKLSFVLLINHYASLGDNHNSQANPTSRGGMLYKSISNLANANDHVWLNATPFVNYLDCTCCYTSNIWILLKWNAIVLLEFTLNLNIRRRKK